MKRKASRRAVAVFAIGAFALAGCELIAEFDRSKIDAGGPDGSFPDVTPQPDVNQPDSPVVDAGSDASDGASTDAADSGVDTGADAAADADAASVAQLGMTPTSNDFGTLGTDAASADFTFTVTNNGGSTSGTMATSITGTNLADFALGTDTCNGNTLAATLTCTVNVHFAPQTTGSKSANIQVAATPGGTASSAITGTAQ